MARRHRWLKRAADPSAGVAAFGGMRGLNPIRRIDVCQSSRTMLLMRAPLDQKASAIPAEPAAAGTFADVGRAKPTLRRYQIQAKFAGRREA
jgi:hypothetical protein